jgi:hypothetical protein
MVPPSSIGHGRNVDPDGKRFEKEIEKRGIGETAFFMKTTNSKDLAKGE